MTINFSNGYLKEVIIHPTAVSPSEKFVSCPPVKDLVPQ